MDSVITTNGIYQIFLYFFILILLVKPLGWYIASVFENKPCLFNQLLLPVEKFIYYICGIHPNKEMNWKQYVSSMLIFNVLGLLFLYIILRVQYYLPLNPEAFPGQAPDLAFNTAISFITNTNWEAFIGENSISYLTDMLGFTVQCFLSAATGLAILMALIRGIVKHGSVNLGNFWVDITRGILYILLPLASILAIFLVSEGVIQNFNAYQTFSLQDPQIVSIPLADTASGTTTGKLITEKKMITEASIPMGPVASHVAIKQLGSNGGGYFNANSAHPFENPTPLSNFLEMLAILLIPAALCYTYGLMIKDTRQGWAILIAMFIIIIPFFSLCYYSEQKGNPALNAMGVNQTPQENLFPGGNMEGKESRFGIVNSTLWTTATSASSNGSTNSMFDSYTPLGGLVPLWLMQVGEVVFGGIGSGIYGILMLVIITVFIAGLLVGRTPEYLGKKIEPFEIKMSTFAVLLMPVLVLIATAIAVVTKAGTSAIANGGAHGFTEILYAFTSMTNNNGSAFSGLNADLPLYNVVGGLLMLMNRYWVAIAVLAIAGSLAQKKKISKTSGTLSTHSSLFIALLICVILLLGALSFLPALALGPIAEHLIHWNQYGS